MKNADMPAMPQPIAMNENECLSVDEHQGDRSLSGLTKRETVAMHILAGICANPNYEPEQQRHFDLATEDALRQTESFFKGLEL
ncbi:hypothetical protein FQP85_22150 [Pseudoalteromonas neustonica]|uniref:Uncharacterized protein n=1 Tax=Pseudoalteromonas neustonica TaxID=1840331 RepID=A0ABY3F7K7_9GAMM|nr:hypothetical protein [Pseudoalteromonas neustonica]TVU79896.1 hypothetical protein FQP85_22150 [Pseudoalteromonas neustonica]